MGVGVGLLMRTEVLMFLSIIHYASIITSFGVLFYFIFSEGTIEKVYNLVSFLPPSVPLFRVVDYFIYLCGLQVSN